MLCLMQLDVRQTIHEAVAEQMLQLHSEQHGTAGPSE